MHYLKSISVQLACTVLLAAHGTLAQDTPVQEPTLPAAEEHIRKGIIQLNELAKCLAAIDSPEKADGAAVKILECQLKLTQWAQGFSTLPKDDKQIESSYEKAYLPIIKKINEQLTIQSERLSAAEYYKSRKLAAALIELIEATN